MWTDRAALISILSWRPPTWPAANAPEAGQSDKVTRHRPIQLRRRGHLQAAGDPGAERAGSTPGVSGPDPNLWREIERRLRCRGAGQGSRASLGGGATAAAATCWSPRGRAACASSRPRARWASRLPACPRWTRGARAACSMSRSAPTFDSDRTIYWSYSEPRKGGNATSVARGVLSADRREPRAGEGDLSGDADLRWRQTFRLPARLRTGRDAVHHAGRAVGHADAAPGAAARQPHGKDPADQPRWLHPEGQPVRRARPRRGRRSGASATGTCRPRRSTPRVSSGTSSTAPTAATS